MNANDFFNLVSRMRSEQIAYFSKRSQYPMEAGKHLIQAKQLERMVDAVIKAGLDSDQPTAAQPQQDGLFPA